ncbi:MAG: NAD-dependent deacylase [Desulfomonile sp.]|jgi:NAD-dependent deacetylase|nr:NAD-dependent deacylase [Deltaproteobacteria bacterium]
MEDLISRAAKALATAQNAVALTGAGISTESGIPDFRSPGGLWTRVDPAEFSIDRFIQDPSRFWRMHLDLKASGDFNLAAADPNPAHHALARMEQMGILKCIITQNVDNLHQRAGSVEVVEFHGNLLRAACMKCRSLEPIENVEARFESGESDAARCQKCGGVLKPDAVFFGEAIPARALMASQVQSQKCDVLVVIGTSLQVYPAAQIPLSVKLKYPPATVIEVNREPSALHHQITDILILGSAGEILSRLLDALEARIMTQ